ncbi:DTW domain-containing protein, partial [Aeromonas caviae]|nr:DTW domain-containing protein [Aeromonas caviae]
SGLILISSRYMAGRVSRAPGADEAPVLEGLAVIKAQSCALD